MTEIELTDADRRVVVVAVAKGEDVRGEVWPTLEVIVTEVGASLTKRIDHETGLALLTGTTGP